MMKILNLTPHPIVVKTPEGLTTFPPHVPKEECPRNSSTLAEAGEVLGLPIFAVQYGETQNLPAPEEGTVLIVSAMVLSANPHRTDLVAPATTHPAVERNKDGHILNVPGFVRN